MTAGKPAEVSETDKANRSDSAAKKSRHLKQDGIKPKIGIKDYLFGLPYVAAFAGTLCFFDVIQRVVTLFGRSAHEWLDLRLNRCLCAVLIFAGATLELRHAPASGKDGSTDAGSAGLLQRLGLKGLGAVWPSSESIVPESGPAIIVSNHQSLLDIPYLTTLLPHLHPKYIAKRELSRWLPYVSYSLRHGGHGLIDRKDPKSAIAEVERVATYANEHGVGVSIFPEGTRARFGGVGRLKPRGMKTLLELMPDAPVVVVSIQHAWKLSAFKLLPAPFGLTIKVTVEKVISRSPDRSHEELIEEAFSCLRERVNDRIAE